MCDATTLISSKQTDLHSCWIIYTKTDGKERLTVTETKPAMLPPHLHDAHNLSQNDQPALIADDYADENDEDDEDDEDGTDQSLHEILDPELQPEPPIPDNAQSQEVYEEHRRLAKEYLRVVTKVYYAQDLKDKLLAQMNATERQEKQDLLKKMKEKEELLELYNDLRQQLDKLTSSDQTDGIVLCNNSAAAAVNQTQSSNLSQTDGNAAPPSAIGAGGSASSPTDVDDGWVVVNSPDQA